MKWRVAACCAFLLLFLSPEGFSQALSDPASVTDVDINTFKLGIEGGCRNRGREVGDPPARVDAFCTCMMQLLNDQVTKDEWKRAVALAAGGKEDEGMQVFSPYFPKLASCRAKPPA